MHFFLSQLYAEEKELGLDPTMKMLLPVGDGPPTYDMTVRVSAEKSVVYRTRELINQDNATSLRGRGTRVWDVILVEDGVEKLDQCGVLKDYWVDSDRTREGDALAQIIAADTTQELEDHLLTVLAHGDVFIDEQVDNTRQIMTRGVDPPVGTRFNLRLPNRPLKTNSRILKTAAPSNAQLQTATEVEYGQVIEYHPKSRYRIVFYERCTPLYKIVSLHAAYDCLVQLVLREHHASFFLPPHTWPLITDLCPALQLIHLAGWVHRDISTGNVLIDKAGKVRLADFEYAKKMDEESNSHDIRTVRILCYRGSSS